VLTTGSKQRCGYSEPQADTLLRRKRISEPTDTLSYGISYMKSLHKTLVAELRYMIEKMLFGAAIALRVSS
jgi:hypothetical protein